MPYYSVEDLCKRYDVKTSTLYNWHHTLNFPQPKKFGRLSRWQAEDIEAWEAEQRQETTPAPVARVEAVKRAMQSRRVKKVAYSVEKRLITVRAPMGYAAKTMAVSVRVPIPAKQGKETHIG